MPIEPAAAQQSPYGTRWVKFEPMELHGRHVGCGLNFGSLIAVRADGQDAAMAGHGQLFVQVINAVASGALKFSMDLLTIRNGKLIETARQPYTAKIRSPSGTEPRVPAVTPGDAANAIFLVFHIDDLFHAAARDAARAGCLSIFYTLHETGDPWERELELDVAEVDQAGHRTRSRRDLDAFIRCLSALPRTG